MTSEYPTQLVVLRHGETAWNAERRFQGHADTPLNERGRRQATAAGRLLERFDFDDVYSSPLQRALDTARLVAPGREIVTDPRLMEIDVGSWAGMTRDEVIADMPGYPALYASGADFRRSPTGETLSEIVARGLPAVREIAEAHSGRTVLIVSHGLLLNRVLHAILGLEGRVLGGFGNAHYSHLGFGHGQWRLFAHNVG